ncbi:hypothetical protein [Hansschlegelia zhihuaiae]|uniref:Secreted protein n=1 Tax=Hansschlegelia zhihuaiae TaxID=405005 RepID=A0A4Q0MNJ1_9HYPH|nr:hypothetical protein [Hansschlegelia zhihuaiae]RXF74596.1 hypothetical protein EK403_04140 [Hansschlegelia zhihuaiae]
MDLVLLVCLVSSPQTCREERLLVSYEQTDPRMCMAGAVPTIAEWTEGHPEWQVSRWKCGAPLGSRLTRNFG